MLDDGGGKGLVLSTRWHVSQDCVQLTVQFLTES